MSAVDMDVIALVAELRSQIAAYRRAGERVALVPTMGFLHDAHISLMELARAQEARVVVSIFVNPTQFGPGEDFDDYPRDFERDAERCRAAGVDVIFTPSVDTMYPRGASVSVVESVVSRGLCGASRPVHFGGVATVVCKLFNLVAPDLAVFGQKDIQQCRVIQQLVRDLHMPIEVLFAPTGREADGLAMSSRNAYLSETERAEAVCLHRGLLAAKTAFAEGERDVRVLCARVEREIAAAGSAELDYVELVSWSDFQTPVRAGDDAIIAAAAQFGRARLIDNVILSDGEWPGFARRSCP